jgi:hypothetical protein
MTNRWAHILRLVDETFENYLAGLVVLRKRVVDDMRRKLREDQVPDPPPRGARPRPTSKGKRR